MLGTCLGPEQAASEVRSAHKLAVVTLSAEWYRPTSEKKSTIAKHTPESVTAGRGECSVRKSASK